MRAASRRAPAPRRRRTPRRPPSLDAQPRLTRIAPAASAGATPIAASTWLGPTLPDEQAEPDDTATPSRSSRISSVAAARPGTAKASVLGSRGAAAPNTTASGAAPATVASQASRKRRQPRRLVLQPRREPPAPPRRSPPAQRRFRCRRDARAPARRRAAAASRSQPLAQRHAGARALGAAELVRRTAAARRRRAPPRPAAAARPPAPRRRRAARRAAWTSAAASAIGCSTPGLVVGGLQRDQRRRPVERGAPPAPPGRSARRRPRRDLGLSEAMAGEHADDAPSRPAISRRSGATPGADSPAPARDWPPPCRPR